MEDTGPRTQTLEATTPRVTRAWYVLATSRELRRKPISRRLYGRPYVLFRGASGQVHALLDRCPHRSVPLSLGSCVDETVRCAYHGWRFDGEGRCVDVPGLPGAPSHPARRVLALPVCEQQGFVWVWADPDASPDVPPFFFPEAEDPRYFTVRKALTVQGSVHATVENALDVPHTAFLHGGLFREDRDRREIRCIVRRYHDRVECEFVGEQAPTGLAARLLSPSGGAISHVDRFHLPSITEVEYRLGDDSHVLLRAACTPVEDFVTTMYAVVSIRTPLPVWLVRPLVQPIALRIFAQDAFILDRQTRTLRAFGEASFVSTDIDVLGGQILRLMHRAARGDPADPDTPPWVRETTMLV